MKILSVVANVVRLPLHSGCLPVHDPLLKHVLSSEPWSMYPTSQLNRIMLFVRNSTPSLDPCAGTPGSPHHPEASPRNKDHTLFNLLMNRIGIHFHTVQIFTVLYNSRRKTTHLPTQLCYLRVKHSSQSFTYSYGKLFRWLVRGTSRIYKGLKNDGLKSHE